MTGAPLSWLLYATQVPASGQGGGIVRYTVELSAALARRDDVRLTVLARAGSAPFFRGHLGAGAAVRTLPDLPVPALSVLERLGTGGAGTRGFDVVQGTKHLVPRRSAGTRVLTVHDMLPLDEPAEFGLLKRVLLVRPYVASLRSADALVCVSAATRARLGAHVPGAVPRARVVGLATSTALRTAVPREVPELRGRRYALVVGDPSPRKNLGLVVDVWPQVVREVPDALLAVVGPPSWGPTARGQQHEALVADGSLAALGQLDDDQLRWCYEHATVVLCPSRVEGFGLPALEALALGAPLITSRDPALCEVSGDAARHLPADDPQAWCGPVVEQLRAGRTPVACPPPRTWDDVAQETVQAALAAREGR